MRILLVANPLHGHVNPLLALGRAALRQGHAVALATGADLAPLAQKQGIDAWSVGMTHAQGGGNQQASWLAYFEAAAQARLGPLLQRCAAWRPDLVVHEETELAGPVVAASLGARAVVQGLGPRLPERLLQWIASAIERVAPGELGMAALSAWRGTTWLNLCPPGLDRLVQDASALNTLALRPTTPDGADDPALMRRIERLPHPRSVFLTLGTVYGGHSAALAAAIEGLQELPVNLIVALGPQGEPALFEGHGKHVLIERLVPLDSVLARCDAVVSQGGSGVMLGALACGLPQLMLPQGADQFRNAELCVRTGAALALQPGDATPSSIAERARGLLDEPRFATAAGTLRDEMAAMPDAEAVVAALAQDPRRPARPLNVRK